jgi:hypothetical protein
MVHRFTSIHMTCHRYWFETYHEKTNGAKIYLGDDRCHEIKGYGDVCVTFPSGHVKQIKNVMYVPGIKKKLILVSTITDQGLKDEFVKSGCLVKDIQRSLQSYSRRNQSGRPLQT